MWVLFWKLMWYMAFHVLWSRQIVWTWIATSWNHDKIWDHGHSMADWKLQVIQMILYWNTLVILDFPHMPFWILYFFSGVPTRWRTDYSTSRSPYEARTLPYEPRYRDYEHSDAYRWVLKEHNMNRTKFSGYFDKFCFLYWSFYVE